MSEQVLNFEEWMNEVRRIGDDRGTFNINENSCIDDFENGLTPNECFSKNILVEKVYSADGEYYQENDLSEVIADLSVGDTYFEGDKVEYSGSSFFDHTDLIEAAQTRAYDDVGEFAENFLDDLKENAIEELKDLINSWAEKHVSVPFWRAENIKEITITQELIDDLAN